MPFFENARKVHISECEFTEIHGNKNVYNKDVHNAPVYHAPVFNGPVRNAPTYYGPVQNGIVDYGPMYNGHSYAAVGGHMGWYGDRSYKRRGIRRHMTDPGANHGSSRRPTLHQNRAHAAPFTVHPSWTTSEPPPSHTNLGRIHLDIVVEALQSAAQLEREKPRPARFREANRTLNEVGGDARENRTRPAWGAQHHQNADHQGPTNSNSKPALFGSASVTMPAHPDFVEALVDEVCGMRIGNAPPSLPRDVTPGPEYEEDGGDVAMEYSAGFDDGIWERDDCGTYTDDGWTSATPTSPNPIPTPSTPTVSLPPAGINTRWDPGTPAALRHGPVYENSSKNITTNDTRGSYNSSSITLQR